MPDTPIHPSHVTPFVHAICSNRADVNVIGCGWPDCSCTDAPVDEATEYFATLRPLMEATVVETMKRMAALYSSGQGEIIKPLDPAAIVTAVLAREVPRV